MKILNGWFPNGDLQDRKPDVNELNKFMEVSSNSRHVDNHGSPDNIATSTGKTVTTVYHYVTICKYFVNTQ